MRVLRYRGTDPRAWGRRHGQAFGDAIRELAEIRLALAAGVGRLRDTSEVLRAAEAHLGVLEAYDTALFAELLGIAEGADLDPARVVVLNHYTDLRDLDSGWESPAPLGDRGCTVIYRRTSQGPILAQTWDIHGSAEPYVLLLSIPPHETPEGTAPAAWVLSITGCLGMCGMNRHGVSIAINNVWSLDARVGLVWSALVRRVLRAETAAQARDLVLAAPLGSGHHYFVSDASGAAYGIETSGVRRRLVYQGEADAFIHTNHCLDDHIAEVTAVSPTSTTHERYRRMTATFDASLPDSPEAMWLALGTDGRSPESVCVAPSRDAQDAHAVATCAVVLMDARRGRLWAQQGAGPEAAPQRFGFDGEEDS